MEIEHNEAEGTTIASVVENRAREVCISKINTRNTTSLEIYIAIDNHAYTETLTILSGLFPDEILLPDGKIFQNWSDY